ncbi:site-specific integrase [Candidatus Peregrinibacteria bacterium]|jgi:site-specific recombinase XerD|nr:site-specific integrase [Candidatus Peregrinibacteria bacterium]MBT4631735.1 site-specific integrase [Candidatus Peregrinibacteria bacterium]
MNTFAPLRILLTLTEEEEFEELINPEHTPLWECWPNYIRRQEVFQHSLSTTRSVRDTLRMLMRHCGIYSVEDYNDPEVIQDALLELKGNRGFGETTYNSYLKNIKSYLIFLRRNGIIKEVHLDRVEKFKNIIHEQHTQTEEEVIQVLAQLLNRRQTTLERLRNIFFYKLLILTGARPSELERLKKENIIKQGEKWTIKIRGGKNKPSNRFYYLPSGVKDALIPYMLYRKQLARNEDWLFASQSKRTGWTSKGMRHLLKKLSKELGFTVGLYSTRRYVATKLALAGATDSEIGNHLGHTRLSTTKRYIKQCGALTKKNVDKLSELLN